MFGYIYTNDTFGYLYLNLYFMDITIMTQSATEKSTSKMYLIYPITYSMWCIIENRGIFSIYDISKRIIFLGI